MHTECDKWLLDLLARMSGPSRVEMAEGGNPGLTCAVVLHLLSVYGGQENSFWNRGTAAMAAEPPYALRTRLLPAAIRRVSFFLQKNQKRI